MSILQQARFYTTANAMNQLPEWGLPELAFAGRSNAGKSTAINTLCQQKRLAFASKTPGRTQHINYFALGGQGDREALPAGFLVDLPGYGYAQVGHAAKAHWDALLSHYIRLRSELVGLVLIMDVRRPLTELDLGLIEWFAPTGKPIHGLLTKADKLNRSEAALALRETQAGLARYGELNTSQLFSSLKRTGVEQAQDRVLEMLGLSDNDRDLAAFQKKAPTQGE
jgi:GTP-binding protein